MAVYDKICTTITSVLQCSMCKQGQYTWKRVDKPERCYTVCLIFGSGGCKILIYQGLNPHSKILVLQRMPFNTQPQWTLGINGQYKWASPSFYTFFSFFTKFPPFTDINRFWEQEREVEKLLFIICNIKNLISFKNLRKNHSKV